MTDNRLLYFALGVLVVLTVGAVGIRDDGIVFADGSFQATAAGFTAAHAVQGESPILRLPETGTCSTWGTLYAVPSGKRLVIEWLSVEGATLGGGLTYPMDLFVRTHDGSSQIVHAIARLEDGAVIGIAFFRTQIWSGPVRLYSEAGQPVEVRLCIDAELGLDEIVGGVSFSGYLIDVG